MHGSEVLGNPLNTEEWWLLLKIGAMTNGAAAAVGAAPSFGRLVMRGLLAAGADGNFRITVRGLDVLARRATALSGCIEGTSEEIELGAIALVLESHRA